MYNRYIRNDSGQYTCIPMEHPPDPYHAEGGYSEEGCAAPPDGAASAEHGQKQKEKQGLLSSLLDKLKPDEIDRGDLLLLVILFLLFKDSEDEELLFILGLVLLLS